MSPTVAVPALALVGLLHAGLWALYVRAVGDERALLAAALDGVLTAFGFLAWRFMLSTGLEESALGILAYALGGSVGTYLGMRRRRPRT